MDGKKIILIGIIIGTLIMTGCSNIKDESNKNKDISINDISSTINKIKTIEDICIVTEDNDPNGKLNKSGGYIGALYFVDITLPKVETIIDDDSYEERPPKDTCEAGTIAGGSIELYSNSKDANNRDDYLSAFDSTSQASGHKQYNNIIIRTSDEFTAAQQKELTEAIINQIEKIK